MKKLNSNKVFVQYRDIAMPYEPVNGRKYTITHSDTTAELFVFISKNYATDQIANNMRDEVRLSWEKRENDWLIVGSVLVDGDGITENSYLRNKIFYNEMPTALQALRQADRFLFQKYPVLDNSHVLIQFISSSPMYHKIHDFGLIGNYK